MIKYRIKALKSFSNIKAGELGGFIESEDNLSEDGDCWIYNDAMVYENAKVEGNAKLFDYAVARGNAVVDFDSLVYGSSIVEDDAIVGANESQIMLLRNKLLNKRIWVFDSDKYASLSDKIHAPIMEQIRLGIRNGMDIHLVKKMCSNNFDWDDVVDIHEYDALLTPDDFYDDYEEDLEEHMQNNEDLVQRFCDVE